MKLRLKDRTRPGYPDTSRVLDDFDADAFSSLESAAFLETPVFEMGPFNASASLTNAFFVTTGERNDGGLAFGPLEPLGTNPGPISPTDVSWISGTNTTGGTGSGGSIASGSGFHINLLYDAAAMAAPQSFRDGVQTAMNLLSAAISDNITVNIKIDYSGTGGGAAAGPDAGLYESYSSVRTALVSHATAGDTTFNSLPNTTSISGQSNVAVWNAQLKLFGLMSPNDTTTDDGSATFATDINPNLLVGVALHELTHALGRVPYGSQPDIFDLFRFTSTGTRLFSGASTAPAAYFSLDGGTTKIADYGRTSDPSDFLNSGIQGSNDPFNEFYTSNTLQQLTAIDLEQLDALGFHLDSAVSRPVVTTANINTTAGQTLAASSLFSVSDPNGYSITEYQFWDSTRDGSSGNFYVNGVKQSAGVVIDITAAQLAQTTFVTGSISDALQVRAYDGHSWSASDAAAWAPFNVNVPASSPPVITTRDVNTTAGQTLAASNLFSVSDPNGYSITEYQFWDSTRDGSSGSFYVNDVKQSAGTIIDITAAQLVQTTFVTGSTSDALQVRAYDGHNWSASDAAAWAPFNVLVANIV